MTFFSTRLFPNAEKERHVEVHLKPKATQQALCRATQFPHGIPDEHPVSVIQTDGGDIHRLRECVLPGADPPSSQECLALCYLGIRWLCFPSAFQLHLGCSLQ